MRALATEFTVGVQATSDRTGVARSVTSRDDVVLHTRQFAEAVDRLTG